MQARQLSLRRFVVCQGEQNPSLYLTRRVSQIKAQNTFSYLVTLGDELLPSETNFASSIEVS